jgi:hypothetical protein
MNPHQRAARLCLLLSLWAGGTAAQTQTPQPPAADAPWVQVEVIVFRHMEPDSPGEAWPTAPALSYPPALRFLLEPGSPEHTAALEAREFERALQAEAGSAAPAAPAAPAGQVPAPDELPGVLLAGQDTVLADAAARIANAPGYRLLAHLAWREPRLAEGARESTLVTGGASAGEHHELEGSITITRSRFLHIDARLWLNAFPAAGESPGPNAVDLPPVPKPLLPKPPAALQAESGMSTEAVQDPVPAEPAVVVEPVRATQTVLLTASRKIAPGEVHYLDHPLLGVLVTVRPWDPAAPVSPEGSAPPVTLPAGTPATSAPLPPPQPGG